MAFGSHGDVGDFYGWIMAYDSKSLKQLASYNTAPDWGQGGVWQSGTGLAADDEGYIYAVVGNGERPSTNAKKNPPIVPPRNILKPVYGNSILKMELNQKGAEASLDVVDWFTASDTMDLNELDNDFIGGPVLFDVPPADGSSGHLIIGGGKDGKIYLGDRNFLGNWMAGTNRRILQAEKLCSFHIHGAPVDLGELSRARPSLSFGARKTSYGPCDLTARRSTPSRYRRAFMDFPKMSCECRAAS